MDVDEEEAVAGAEDGRLSKSRREKNAEECGL